MDKSLNKLAKGRLVFDTIKYLKPVQIKYQILRRVKGKQKKIYQHVELSEINKVHILIPELDESREYLSKFDVDGLLRDEVELIHERHSIDGSWNRPTASHLWNYNLHYLEFTVALAEKYKQLRDKKYKLKWEEIVISWMDASHENQDAYEPYTISLRIPNLLIGLELLGGNESIQEQKIYESIYIQYKYLLAHQELALLANHYFENLKTIVISSVLFGESNNYRKYFKLFLKQAEEQILADGLHFERSLMYHKIILEDILRVFTVLQSAGNTSDARKLIPSIKVMAEALGGIEHDFGRTPLFNDAGDNVSKSCTALLKACKNICGNIDMKRTKFPHAGYYRLDNGEYIVLFDCGHIGPRYMGGHSHNDCLSFELSIEGKMIFVNSGTGQYQGNLRSFFRSTAAHNTVMIDDREQSELWGEHRAARRISHIKSKTDSYKIVGQFRSYQGDGFRRKIHWKGNCLIISDDVKSADSGKHVARQFFHLSPEYRFEKDGAVVRVVMDDKAIAIVKPCKEGDFLIHTQGQVTAYAQDFGKYEKKEVLEVRIPFADSVRIDTEIEMLSKEKEKW